MRYISWQSFQTPIWKAYNLRFCGKNRDINSSNINTGCFAFLLIILHFMKQTLNLSMAKTRLCCWKKTIDITSMYCNYILLNEQN